MLTCNVFVIEFGGLLVDFSVRAVFLGLLRLRVEHVRQNRVRQLYFDLVSVGSF